MLENPKILLTILAISIILIVLLFRALKAEEKSRYDLLEKEKELNNFRGYKEEVEQLKREILNSLPKGMEKISSLWVDLNIIFDRLNEEWEQNSYSRRRKIRNHVVVESAEVRELRSSVRESKLSCYKLDMYERRLEYVVNVLKGKYNEEIDDVLLKQCVDEIKKQRAEEENMHKRHIGEYLQRKEELENEIYNLQKKKDKLKKDLQIEKALIEKDIGVVSLKSQKKQIENEITSLLDTFDISVEEAKRKIESEENTPTVLKKIVDAWVEYKGIMWECQLYSKLKNRTVGYATVDRLQTSLREFKKKMKGTKEVEYRYLYIMSLFPELQEYIDGDAVREDVVEVTEEYEDRREKYLTKEEWMTLSDTAKSQLALDRYNEKRKRTNAQVGRDYEEYIAYLFNQRFKKCDVSMFGEQKGLSDLGRDLIVKHRGKVYIVQCKRWSQDKQIREKHIMQLFGSTIEYCWDTKVAGVHPLEVVGKSVIPVFVATTDLSDTAKQFTERLGVVFAKVDMGEYPQIKCNIGRDGEKIYHLPFDQQYNRVIIEREKGEFMAWTVEEAEKHGFRRAKKYYNV